MYKIKSVAIKSLLLFMAGLFIWFLVEKCTACQTQKSDFGCLMRRKVEKYQAILALLDSNKELHIEQ